MYINNVCIFIKQWENKQDRDFIFYISLRQALYSGKTEKDSRSDSDDDSNDLEEDYQDEEQKEEEEEEEDTEEKKNK